MDFRDIFFIFGTFFNNFYYLIGFSMALSKFGIINLFFVLLMVSVTLGLSSVETIQQAFSTLKYIFLFLFALVFMAFSRGYKVDEMAFSAYAFFIFSTILFTAINQPDIKSFFTCLGYVILLAIWISSQNRLGVEWCIRFFREKFLVLIWAHVLVSIIYLFDSGSFTSNKGQYIGYLHNPNAFAGITGVLLVLLSSSLKNCSRSSFFHRVFLSFVLGVLLILAGSRAVLLCTFLAFLVTNVNFILKLFSVVFGLMLGLFLYSGSFFDKLFGKPTLNRDLMESTGRVEILSNYLSALIERSLIWGAGLSEAGGRIKAELAYADVILFSGIGSIGFFIFLILGLNYSYKASRLGYEFLFPVCVFVTILSFFEGYLANVMAVPTIIFYLFHGASTFICRSNYVIK